MTAGSKNHTVIGSSRVVQGNEVDGVAAVEGWNDD
jgi:hypothetical protein